VFPYIAVIVSAVMGKFESDRFALDPLFFGAAAIFVMTQIFAFVWWNRRRYLSFV
jgi:hypothetical protein